MNHQHRKFVYPDDVQGGSEGSKANIEDGNSTDSESEISEDDSRNEKDLEHDLRSLDHDEAEFIRKINRMGALSFSSTPTSTEIRKDGGTFHQKQYNTNRNNSHFMNNVKTGPSSPVVTYPLQKSADTREKINIKSGHLIDQDDEDLSERHFTSIN